MLCECKKCRWTGAESEIYVPGFCPNCNTYGGLEEHAEFNIERERLEAMNNVTVYDLNRDCLMELKGFYISELVNDGTYGEIVHGDKSIVEPSYEDVANIDELIPDDMIFEHYKGMSFGADDFFCLVEDEG